MTPITLEKKLKIYRWVKAGNTQKSACEKFGVYSTTVKNIMKMELPTIVSKKTLLRYTGNYAPKRKY